METEKGKFDKIIDILFPLDMSCFFDIRRMETSIKVMLVAFIFVGFIIKSMDVVEMLNIQDLTLSMMCVIMVVSCVVFFLLYMAVIYVVNLGWDVIIMALKSLKKIDKKVVTHSEGLVAEQVVESPSVQDVAYEEKLSNLGKYIRTNPNKFSTGEEIAMLYILLRDKGMIAKSLKKFHDWIKPLVDCVEYNAFTEARRQLQSKLDEKEEKSMDKYEDLLEEVKDYIDIANQS